MILRRSLVFTAAAMAVVTMTATAAGAHLEPTITEVSAGSSAEVGFVPDHDCDGSPTVRVDIQSPDSVTDPTPVDKDGWMASVEGQVVTYEWEGVGGEDPNGFAVGFTVPNVAGETLLFPTIQTCAEGSIDWIQTEADGDRPAPRVKVTEADASATTEPETTEANAEDTTTPTEDESTTTTTITGFPPGGDVIDESNTGLYVAIGAVVIAAGAGGAVYMRRRKQG